MESIEYNSLLEIYNKIAVLSICKKYNCSKNDKNNMSIIFSTTKEKLAELFVKYRFNNINLEEIEYISEIYIEKLKTIYKKYIDIKEYNKLSKTLKLDCNIGIDGGRVVINNLGECEGISSRIEFTVEYRLNNKLIHEDSIKVSINPISFKIG